MARMVFLSGGHLRRRCHLRRYGRLLLRCPGLDIGGFALLLGLLVLLNLWLRQRLNRLPRLRMARMFFLSGGHLRRRCHLLRYGRLLLGSALDLLRLDLLRLDLLRLNLRLRPTRLMGAGLVHHGLHLRWFHGDRGRGRSGQPLGLVMITRFDPLSLGGVGHPGPASIDFRSADLLAHSGGGEARSGRFDFRRVDNELGSDLAGKLRAVVLSPIALGAANELQRGDTVL